MKKIDVSEIQERGKFATILKCLLMKNKVSQGEFATAIGLSQATVTHYIKGRYTPSQKTLGRIAEFLNVSPNVFYGDVEDYTMYLNKSINQFASTLYGLIKEKGLTCEQFAKEIGVSRQTISNYINEKQMPTTNVAKKIADYFGVSMDMLINGDEKKEKGSGMKLYVTNTPETPEDCIFCDAIDENPLPGFEDEIRYFCKLCNTDCKMNDGVCPYIRKK